MPLNLHGNGIHKPRNLHGNGNLANMVGIWPGVLVPTPGQIPTPSQIPTPGLLAKPYLSYESTSSERNGRSEMPRPSQRNPSLERIGRNEMKGRGMGLTGRRGRHFALTEAFRLPRADRLCRKHVF